MSSLTKKPLLFLAFLTATACSIHVFENLIMRLLPLPFIRLGLSNVVVLYLILKNQAFNAIAVNVAKSLIGGMITFTLLSPATLLSLSGGMAAIFAMWAVYHLPLGFSEFGVSVVGALAHNLTQMIIVQQVVLPGANVFILTPLLLFLGLISGVLTAWILLLVKTKYEKQSEYNDHSG